MLVQVIVFGGLFGLVYIVCVVVCDLVFVCIDCAVIFCGVMLFVFWTVF